MKIFKRLALVVGVVLASSCTLDLREDPNAVQPNQVLPSLLLNSIQRQFPVVFNAANTSGAQMTRLLNGAGSVYQVATTPETFNGIWTTSYAGILADAHDLIKIADQNGFARHAGIARVIQSYTLLILADMFGKVPFSEAFQGAANFNPKADNDNEIYEYVLTTLDKAKVDLTTPATTANPAGYLNPVAPTINDQYYDNNYTRWVKLINTLKLKVYLNLRLTDAARATTAINALIADATPTGGFINAQNENFIWRYGTTTSDPDARHPRFTAQYPGGGGDYQSNWLMWHMFHSYNASQNGAPGDPRMRFYFYRQVVANTTSSNELRCLTESLPDHYPSATPSAIILNPNAGLPPMGVDPAHPSQNPSNPAWSRTFCVPTDRGYWGRDHVDPQGIPPDGQLRTAYGPYPVGGRFDNNSATGVTATVGMRGAGMQPIMLRSFVQFMLAEAGLTLTLTDPLTPRDHYTNGVNFSFTDVRDWSVNGTFGSTAVAASPNEATTINAFYPAATYTTDVTNYRTSALAAYDDRLVVSNTEALNYVAREFWVALVGNGYEAYNLYRRTGKPTGMQPVINPSPGNFPRSFWYPANFANLNSSVTQKPDLTVRVFWDNNTTNLNF
ncbi:MAG: SusD/RagB family nutrient-binding outer membrane lipoprotein [Cyclobacteriaceae bacterium]|nr:SusD/RagB family nutrient-binding outer membrane lipoprotein [Cyclobacteriaceae bacterium]